LLPAKVRVDVTLEKQKDRIMRSVEPSYVLAKSLKGDVVIEREKSKWHGEKGDRRR